MKPLVFRNKALAKSCFDDCRSAILRTTYDAAAGWRYLVFTPAITAHNHESGLTPTHDAP